MKHQTSKPRGLLRLCADGQRLGYQLGKRLIICECITGDYLQDIMEVSQRQDVAFTQVVEALRTLFHALPMDIPETGLREAAHQARRALALAEGQP